MSVLKVHDGTTWIEIPSLKGEDGTDGVGVPSGGTTGQVLKKASGTDYDTEWGDAGSGLPSGGTQGQVLVKNSSTDGDVSWGENVCMITVTDGLSDGYNVDKDMADVLSAYQAGKPIMMRYRNTFTGESQYYELDNVDSSTVFYTPINSNDTQSAIEWTFTFNHTNLGINDASAIEYVIHYRPETDYVSVVKTTKTNNIVKDVKIGNTSLVSSGIATIPTATTYSDGYMPSASQKKLNYTNVCYCTCDSSADSAVKLINPLNYDASNVPDVTGAVFFIKFTNTNTATNITFDWMTDEEFSTELGYVYYDGSRLTSATAEYGGSAGKIGIYVRDNDAHINWVGWSTDPSSGSSGGATVIYATTNTAAATQTKVLTASNVPSTLVDGTLLMLYSTYTNTTQGTKFQFDGSSESISVSTPSGTIASSSAEMAGTIGHVSLYVLITQNGYKYWRSVNAYADSTAGGILHKDLYTKLTSYTNVLVGSCSTAATTAVKEINIQSPKGVGFANGCILIFKPQQTNTATANAKFKIKFYSVGSSSQSTSSEYSVQYYGQPIHSGYYPARAGDSSKYQMYVMVGGTWHWIGQSFVENTTYTTMSQSEADTGTSTNSRLITPKVLHDTVENIIENMEQTVLLDVVDENGTSSSQNQKRIYQLPSQIKSLIEDERKFFVKYNSFEIYPARASVVEEWNETAQDYLNKVVVSYDRYNADNNTIETYALSSYIDEEHPEQEQELSGDDDPIIVTPTADTIVYDNTETYSSGSIGEAVKNIEGDVETLKDGMTFIKYGISTWDDFITAYNNNNVVYCRASSGSNPASGSQTRLAFMAYVNNAETPTEVEFQYYRSLNQHTASQQGDQVYVYKLQKTGGWSVTTRECSAKIVAGTGLTSTYSNGVLTISLA